MADISLSPEAAVTYAVSVGIGSCEAGGEAPLLNSDDTAQAVQGEVAPSADLRAIAPASHGLPAGEQLWPLT